MCEILKRSTDRSVGCLGAGTFIRGAFRVSHFFTRCFGRSRLCGGSGLGQGLFLITFSFKGLSRTLLGFGVVGGGDGSL